MEDGAITGALLLRCKRTFVSSTAEGAGTAGCLFAPSLADPTVLGNAAITCATTGCAAAPIGAATASPTFGPNSSAINRAPADATVTPLLILLSVAIPS